MKSRGILTNFIWRLLERCGAQGVTLIVSIVLARLLDPEVYGTLALVTVFTTILQVFVDSGLGNALIQKKDADDLDFSSVFYFNICVCILLYAVIFFSAPLIAKFYGKAELTPVVRVMSCTLIISGIKNVQQAYVSRNMLFKKFFFATLGGTIGAAIIGIILAYKGFGIWALVAQNLFNQTVDTIILWISVKWRPKLIFSWERLKGLISYGSKLLGSALIDRIYTECRLLIIGKKYSSSDLAFYSKGRQFPNLIANNINDSIDSVLFPTMSKVQDRVEQVKSITRRSIGVTTYIMAPLMIGLAVCAEPIVRLVLGEKWLPCVFFLRIFCLTFLFYPIHTSNLNAIKALGRSDIILKLEMIKKAEGFGILIISMWFGVKAIAIGTIVQNVLGQIINSWPNRKLMHYSYLEQIKDIIPCLMLALVMGAIAYMVSMIGLSDILTLLLQVIMGAVIYVGGSVVFKIEYFNYSLKMIRAFLNKGERKNA